MLARSSMHLQTASPGRKWAAAPEPTFQIALPAEPLLAVADLLLGTLRPADAPAAATPPTPFPLSALSPAPGSGAALEDWLASVVSGGDAGGQGEREAENNGGDGGGEDGEEEEEEEGAWGGELLARGGCAVHAGAARCLPGRSVWNVLAVCF
jgi:hypothetical protein